MRLLFKLLLLLIIAIWLTSVTTFAQVDLTGIWAPPRPYDEDEPERGPGPSLVEFVGLPINEYAREWGLAYRPGRLSLPEHQCQVHVVGYIHRGPLQMRMWEERDPITHQLVAIHEAISTYEQKRTIWMDGRPRPSEYAPHTWMGFSTGVWEGNMLTVTTTHIKQGWQRRENIPASDELTLIEHYIKRGSLLTHISIAEDPIFLAEPLLRSQEFSLVADPNAFNAFWPCEYVEEGERPRGEVPSYFHGENPWVSEYAATHNLPLEATLGGAETIYPEYQSRLKQLPKAVYQAPAAAPH
jgi:hypothetical protein